jgi:hypothetical protein
MRKLLISLVCLIVLAVLVVYFLQSFGSKPAAPSVPAPVSSVATITGKFACLPHKGNGPSTMECAYGMKGDDGFYYALDMSGVSASAFDLPMDRPYSVTGLLVPVEALNSDHWRIYDIKGVMKVSSYKEVASGIPSYPAGSTVTLELNKPVTVGEVTIRVGAVIEDSRCPSDVQCIQAGRVRIALSLALPTSPSQSSTLEVGKSAMIGTTSFTLEKVEPYPVSTRKIADSEYRFTFRSHPTL